MVSDGFSISGEEHWNSWNFGSTCIVQSRDVTTRVLFLYYVTGSKKCTQTSKIIPYQNGDTRTEMGIVQSLSRIGLGFVPIWDFRF